MEPRMLDKINDLKRLQDEARLANTKADEIKKQVLNECQAILGRAELTIHDLTYHMTPF